MHLDATFFAFVALAIFIGILMKIGVHKQILKSLDDRSNAIAKELAEAQRLRAEAERLLASYESKRQEAEREAAATLEQAKKDAAQLAAEAKTNLDEAIKRRMRQAQERIARAEEQTIAEIRGAATDAAINAAGAVLRDKLGAAEQSKLVSAGITELASKLR
ncbi:MAG: ATP F0F1 synthase subunit B [Caulobacterales bacterium]